jgi:hypothetical protein
LAVFFADYGRWVLRKHESAKKIATRVEPGPCLALIGKNSGKLNSKLSSTPLGLFFF